MSRLSRHSVVPMALVVIVTVLAGACGVPRDATGKRLDDADVPYGLLEEEPPVWPDDQAGEGVTRLRPKVFWLDEEGSVIAAAAQGSLPRRTFPLVESLLAQLAAGPVETQRDNGIGTALGPGVGLTLVELRARTAVIEVTPSSEVPSADRLPFAVGQIVLTAVSVPGIDKVLFERDGEILNVPLPGGALTTKPLTSVDYQALLAAKV